MINNNQFKYNASPQCQQPQYQQYQKQPEYQQITIQEITYKRFLQPIGEGVEGTVYKGENIKTKEIVAIKVYKQKNQNELNAIQRIQKMNYSHIIGIKGVDFNQNSYPIVVMEFANGEFYQFMQSQEYQNLSYDKRNSYFLQMVQGVEQLHELGLFHRDLKPENFVYIKDSKNKITIKLIDFGLVKENSNISNQTYQVGTPYYMAPEVVSNQNKLYDKSVDIWSLGALWYEILTDETFFYDNSEKEIFSKIRSFEQSQIDQKIQANYKIQLKEKNVIKQMLFKESSKRIQLKDILASYKPNNQKQINKLIKQLKINENKFPIQQLQQNQSQFQQTAPVQFVRQPANQQLQINNLVVERQKKEQEQKQELEQKQKQKQKQIQDEMQKQKDEELKQKMIEFESKKQEEMEQLKREIEKKLEQKLGEQQQNTKDPLKKEYEEQIKQKEKELQELKEKLEKAHQYEKDQKQQALIKIQLEMQFQNEMEQFKKYQDDEQKKELEKVKQKAQIEKNQEIEQQLKIQEERIKKQIETDIEKKYLLEYNQKITQLEDQKKKENQQQLEEKKQSLIIQLKSIQNTINTFIQNLTEKLKMINEINTEDQKRQQLSTYIKDELQKYQENMNKNEQRLEQIKYAQYKENLQRYDIELNQESQQYIQDYNLIIENITNQQSLLKEQVKDKEQFDQQRKEQEEKLKKEQEQYQTLFKIVKSQFTSQSSSIKTISEQINFFQEIEQQIQGKEKIQDVIRQHSQISQDIQVLESQEKIILQFDSLQQINLYLQFNSKLEEIQQTQNRLKLSIEEANKSIQLIDTQFTNKHYKQIDEVNEKLDDFLDQFKYLSKHQKYANKIDQIINQIAVVFGQLNFLKQLITKRTQVAIQQYNQTNDQIQQTLRDFQKQYNQLHEQICNDQQIEQKNIERQRKLQITQDLLNSFKQKMNELQNKIKNLIDNQYCNNEQTQNLINKKLMKINQNIFEYQQQFDNYNQFNQLNSCQIINYQIIQLQEFENKLNEVEVNEIEQVDQLKLIIQKIGVENKNEQEKEIVNLNNQLLNKYKQYSKALKSIKFQFESIEFYKQMNQKKGILNDQLNNEISILKEYVIIQHENSKLFKQKLIDIKKGQQTQQLENLLKKMQKMNQPKGERLENVCKSVSKKQLDLHFSLMDDNIIQNYEQLKKEEIQQSIEVNKINEKISNQQLNPQQLIELKEYILKICSTIDHLIMKIPQNNQIQEFNHAYQQNLESYQKVYALINYIKQYHLTRYYERIKESVNEQRKKQQKQDENGYKKQFKSKLNVEQEEHTKREKEAQNILYYYEQALTNNQNMIAIEVMEKQKEQMEKQIVEIENQIKSKNQVKLRSNLKDQSVIKEIINKKQYYKITEFSYMLTFQIIQKENNNAIQQVQSNQY